MMKDKLEREIQKNHVLQEAAQESQQAYECLYRASLMRENIEHANDYRDKALACLGETLDLQAANYELHKRLNE